MTHPILNDIQALIIDMDGVLWRGNTPLPGLQSFFAALHRRQMPFVLATNNARKTPPQYLRRLADFGVQTVNTENILTSALATAAYLKDVLPPGALLYAIGETGLHVALQEAGFVLAADDSQPVEAVVASLDTTVTYEKLKQATVLIRAGARFIGTNGDLTYPIEGTFAPGAGALLKAIEVSCGVEPTIVGKPERLMFDIAVQRLGGNRATIAMIGDRLETDVLGGQRAGLPTILVTTGVDDRDSVALKRIEPTTILSGIAEIAALL